MWTKVVGALRRRKGGAEEEEPSIEGKEIKNVTIITIAFQLVYTGFYALQNLHSSLHDEDNLGLVCLSVLYGTGIISSVLSPAIIGRFGVKSVLVTAFAAHSVYILANFYASFASMVPGAIFLGAFFGPAWTSQGVYVSACSFSYSKTSSSSPFSVLSRFNGFFFAVMASTQILGNVFTSLVIRDGIGNNSEVLVFKYCGHKDCPAFENATEIEDVEPWVIDVTMSVFMALSICGLLLIFFTLTPLPGSEWVKDISAKKMTTAFADLLFTANMAMLIPFMIFTGMEQAFLMGSFTKSYISCPIGIHMVGFVMSAYGITTPLFFLLFSKLVRVTGRFLLVMASSVLYLVLLIFLLHWEPREEDTLVVFMVPIMWGIAESIQQAQANALIALLFPDQKEAAFAHFHAWRSLGYCVTFLNVAYLCVSDKIIICIGCLVIGSGLYVLVEIKAKVKEKDDIKSTPCNGANLALDIGGDEEGVDQQVTMRRSTSVASFASIQERLSFSHHELREIIKDAEHFWHRDSTGSFVLKVDEVMSEEHLRESKVTTLFHARPLSDHLQHSARSSPVLTRALTRSHSESQFQTLSGRRVSKNKKISRTGSSSGMKKSSSFLAERTKNVPPRRVTSFHAQINRGYESDDTSYVENGNSVRSLQQIEVNNVNSGKVNGSCNDYENGVDNERQDTGVGSYNGVSRLVSSEGNGKENIEMTEIHLGGGSSKPTDVVVADCDKSYNSSDGNNKNVDKKTTKSENNNNNKTSSGIAQSSLIEKMNKRLSSKRKDDKKKSSKDAAVTAKSGKEENVKTSKGLKLIRKLSDSKKSAAKANANSNTLAPKPSLLERRNGSASNLTIDNLKAEHIGGKGKVSFYINSPNISPHPSPHTESVSPSNFTFQDDYTFRRHSIKTNAIDEEEETDSEEDGGGDSKADSDGFVDDVDDVDYDDVDEEENEDGEFVEGFDGYPIHQRPMSSDNADTISIY